MKTPKIDINSVPGLESAQALFGSLSQKAGPYNDGVVDLMVYLYDAVPPEAVL